MAARVVQREVDSQRFVALLVRDEIAPATEDDLKTTPPTHESFISPSRQRKPDDGGGGGAEVQLGIDNSVCIEWSVTDTGVGIAPEDQANIFQPFTEIADTSISELRTATGTAQREHIVIESR